MNDDNYEIVFKKPIINDRVPLYKLSLKELLAEYEKECGYVYDSNPIDRLSVVEINDILNPYRDEIARRTGE